MEQTKTREPFFDILKGLLIFCVVLGHGKEFGLAPDIPVVWSTYFFVYLFHMPAFLFIMGYFSKSTAASCRKIFSRALWFLLLFVLSWALYHGAFYLFLGDSMPEWARGYDPLVEQAVPWYLLSSVFFTLLLLIARKVPGKIFIPLAFAAGLLIGLVSPEVGQYCCFYRTFVYLPFFLIGYYFPKKAFDKLLEKPRAWYWIGLMVLVVVWALVYFGFKENLWEHWKYINLLYCNQGFEVMGYGVGQGILYRAIYYAVTLFMTAAVIFACLGLRQIVSSKAILQVGQNTLPIYMIHYPMLVFLYSIFGTVDTLTYLVMVALIVLFWAIDAWDKPLRYLHKGISKIFGVKEA